MSWQPWVTEVDVQGATGGRRGPGSANHCMHGKDAVVEEILDWRPYDYVTDRTILDDADRAGARCSTPSSSSRRTTGTTIHMRFAAPKTKREKALMEHDRPGLRRGARVGCPEPARPARDAAGGARGADGGPEPELATPRPDGPLAGLQPLVIVG